ncbi:hypothetical protein [Tropicimonas marinistellae]|uniref:hypothetical protein n=1 Tax=Tropicimonas marinistellae TaxID=1739787 RepID=UPI0008315E69|nr:hypothetical protein [Tropicimonas marinistellae]
MFYNPFLVSARNWQKTSHAYQQMWMAANEVIWHRMVQMMTGTMSAGEASRMVLEKPAAFARAAQHAGEVAIRGGDAASVARAAVKPLRIKTRSNARRLRG